MRNKFRIALLSMAAVGFVGCADKLTDDVAQGGQGNGDEAENYVVFKIGNIGSETRATPNGNDFHEGLAGEHAVSTKAGANVVYFFDDFGKHLPYSPLEVLGQQESNDATNDDHNSNYGENAKEKVYQARIKGTEETLRQYKQCLVILNGDPEKLNGLKEKDLADILKELNEGMGWLSDGGTDYFTMSNTVYINDNDKSVKSTATIDPDKQICTTMAEAQKDPIVVHVERVLAKFELNKGTSTDNPTPITEAEVIEPTKTSDNDDKNLYITLMTSTKETEEDSVTEDTTGESGTVDDDDSESPDHYTEWKASNRKWKVKIVGWGMNATESETFWFKNLKDKDEKTFDSEGKFGAHWTPIYTDNTIGWNDYARLRSYWAVDPHYNGNGGEESKNYPHQYRAALDDEKNSIVSGVDAEKLVLKYSSYNDFEGFDKNNRYKYTVENTFDYDWFADGTGFDFKGSDYKRTSTHAVVAAELLIADSEEENAEYAAKTVYQYDSYYWEAEGTEKYKDMPKSLKKYMLNQVLFHWSLDNGFKELYTDAKCETPLVASSKNFDTYFDVVAATVKGGDGRAMMQLKKTVTLYYKDEKGELARIEYDQYDTRSYDAFTQTYLYGYGTARRFGAGKMYYYIPIKHMSADNDKVSTPADYEYNVGKWGVVRNHWYKLNINAIKNPGIPVDDPDQPIIPNDDPDQDYYAAFEIVILPWHVIDNDVTFE